MTHVLLDDTTQGEVYVLGIDIDDARRRLRHFDEMSDESALVMMRSGLVGTLPSVRTRGARRIAEGYRVFRATGENLAQAEILEHTA